VAKGRIPAQQLKHDPLMDQYVKSRTWVEGRSRPLLTGLVIAAVAVAAVLVFRFVSSSRASAAGEALAEAFRVNDAVVSNPLPPNPTGYAYATEDEKHRRAFEAFEKAARDYPSYHGDLARYFAATHQLYFDAPKAEATLKEISQQNSQVAPQARLALAERYATTGRSQEALDEFQKLKAKPGNMPAALVDFHLAQVYEAMGKTQEAAELYFNIANQDRSSPVGTASVNRLVEIDPARIEKLPALAPINPVAPR